MRLRKSLKMTQVQLSQDICTQSTISMIEKGEIKPGLDILYLISIKLNKPISYFANLLLDKDYSYKYSIVQEIEEQTTMQNYQLVYSITERELSYKQTDEWFFSVLKWNYYLSSYKTGIITIDTTILELKKLLEDTKNIVLEKDFLKERIYNTLAFLYATKKNFEFAMFYYNKIDINKDFSATPRLNQEIYYLRIIYNKSKTYYDMGDLLCSQELILLGIRKSIKLENMSFLGNFYYYLGLIQERLNAPISEISTSFQNAYYFFKILERTPYIEIIENKKSEYLNLN